VRRRSRRYLPFARSGRTAILAIFGTFGLIAAVSLTLSVRATDRSQNRATIVETVVRQRTLAERYLAEVLMVRSGEQADPAEVATWMRGSVHALLYGGTAPAVDGDDDDTPVAATTDPQVRAQLVEEDHLVNDMAAYGSALLAHGLLSQVPVTGGEKVLVTDPLQHLRVLSSLVSNVALNTGRTIAAQADSSIDQLRVEQIGLSIGGLLVSLLLAWALIATTRRQSAHFRTLVTSSSDLVLVLDSDGCRYASRSVCKLVGAPEEELLARGLWEYVDADDHEALEQAATTGEPQQLMIRLRNQAGEWRHLEARLTDLRGDRHLRGVVVSARDATERVGLERELALQGQRDAFGTQLAEALEMVDEERDAYDLVERAMVEISSESPIELLLADSSRAHLDKVASSSAAGAPGCPVQSPFSCVAVRRGQPVTFDSSEALNTCPKLRDRPGGACSAVCVPVGFMGRALGVLHATGPDGQPPDPDHVAQLTTLATQAGARIGTLRAFEKTQLQAATDSLTGLINRRTIESRVRDLLAAGRPFALAVADLDRFKLINDTYGHETGDRALRRFAQAAGEALREDDLLARWGGEEFVIVLPDGDRHQAVPVLERIRGSLAQTPTGDHPRFTASFGVTDSVAARTIEELMFIADMGLYRSKEDGRDRITIGEPASDEHLLQSLGGPLRPSLRPLVHDAGTEPEPRSTGLEIR
jgi:diguanylate cyclase (GGDEF)-like protein/PAS domain S-box-containing protein